MVSKFARLIRNLFTVTHYYSTHCYHGHHEMCKVTCKHCDEICKCEVCNHKEGDDLNAVTG